MSAEQLPLYRSHKTVRAGIFLGDAMANADPRIARLSVQIAEGQSVEIEAPDGIFARGRPVEGQDYIVLYPDGYVSWSPKAAFEDGYDAVAETAETPAPEPPPEPVPTSGAADAGAAG